MYNAVEDLIYVQLKERTSAILAQLCLLHLSLKAGY